MDYDAALAFWLGRVDFERRTARPGDLKLEAMAALLARIGDPHRRLRIAHVAGTKGKGSTAAFIAAIAAAAGQRVGLFTSPHLTDVAERIRIGGAPISRDALAGGLTAMRPAVEELERLGHSVTFFEIATALAFWEFDRTRVDLAVMEVGLGGRFDATNVCQPAVSVITSISYDHTAILGDRIAQIAFEKCGIIKPNVPVVSGAAHPDAAAVVRQIAAERGCRLLELGRDVHVTHRPGEVTPIGAVRPPRITVDVGNEVLGEFPLGLLGEHQADNAALAVVALRLLAESGPAVPEGAFRRGLADVDWPARMEVFPGPPLAVLDCAHNVASAEALCATLRQSFPRCSRHLIFACAADKDAAGMLAVLLPQFDGVTFTRFRANNRFVAPDRLAALAAHIRPDLSAETSADASRAVENTLFADPPPDILVITGSVFLAGEVRPLLVKLGRR
jgi:dihydrofolate synthase/folylpolyglutamate synthase